MPIMQPATIYLYLYVITEYKESLNWLADSVLMISNLKLQILNVTCQKEITTKY